MKRYEKHIFICENKRDKIDLKGSCADKGSLDLKSKFKQKLKEKGLSSEIRSNSCGCLGACDFGPVVVIYPEQVWYGNVTAIDVDEIIEDHILNNKIVERLTIKDPKFNKDEK